MSMKFDGDEAVNVLYEQLRLIPCGKYTFHIAPYDSKYNYFQVKQGESVLLGVLLPKPAYFGGGVN